MILQQKIVLTELNNEHWWFNQEKMNLAIENIVFFLAVANAMIIGYKKGMYKQRQFAPGDCVGCQDPT